MKKPDVLVIGGGGAGLAAAITAAEAGRSVLLLEKGERLGGSTGWSIGSITAAGTPDQRAAGIQDSWKDHLADMPAWAADLAARDNMALCEVLTRHAADAVAWLRESGVEFIGVFEEPPHRKPRMHNVLPNSGSYIYHLSRRARRAGVQCLLQTRAEKLLQDADGRVVGVQACGPDGQSRILSAEAVVLAGGDFNASREFKIEFGNADQTGIPAVNSLATGDCQRMGRVVGGRIVNGDIALNDPRFRFAPPARRPWFLSLPPVRPITTIMRWAMRVLPPRLARPFIMSFVTTALAPEAHLLKLGAVLVNKNGETFLREGEKIGHGIARQPDNAAWLFMDGPRLQLCSHWPNFVSTAPGVAYAYIDDYERNRPDLCTRGKEVRTLAVRNNMPVEALQQAAQSAGFESGPYLLLGPIHAVTVIADGGLAVSPRLEVLDAADAPIPGLYAAGSAGQGGLLLKGHGHHLAWAFVSGRIAGRLAADEVRHGVVPVSPFTCVSKRGEA
ncbi:FAD-dependent oxidoreductase [Candidimonas nitroreducens]|uniref:FAD-binding dehydrogenase n=1 Tax=Candidimonas nitroreducens TaxID=683354 RepID=A0A225M0A4_9BURK|nr:FAD-dependent oxidoreductase [Candidimonas nitroreducens]OWT54814.1 FAD-binding dehydrogenase [Candidimonas nitroreducens]